MSAEFVNNLIMVVEDSDEILSLIRTLLEYNGYRVIAASNGYEALEILRAASSLPAFILLDLMMPKLDGFAFRELQIVDPKIKSIPIVVMTAFGDIEEKCNRIGGQDFLKKPFDIKRLESIARKFCSMKSQDETKF